MLWRRARVFLGLARELLERGEYDVALVMAEQAAQLALGAAYTRVMGSAPRGYGLRRLLGYLSAVLEEAGLVWEARRLRSLAADLREDIILLEDAYVEARYEPGEYTRGAERGVRAAEAIIAELDRIAGGRRVE